MKIQSDYLTEGLFGQVFAWMLEILPYLESKKLRPEWLIRTKNYGQPPDFNIFPSIICTAYAPEPGGDVASLEQLQARKKYNLRHNFSLAAACWNSYFRFTDDVYQRLDKFWQENLAGQTVLGLHYRGTDKNTDTFQTNPVSQYQFLCVVEDFLKTHPDVTAIFVASDDARFLKSVSGFARTVSHVQERSAGATPLWNSHQAADNQAVAKDAILDCLTLSRCRYVLKCMSQLSAFSKVFAPELEVYRVSACKPNWFPEAYIPCYRSKNRAMQSLLGALQDGDYLEPLYWKALTVHRRAKRLAAQAWKRRARIGEAVRRVIFRKEPPVV